jgi:cell fate regulator YaaT (PSP1 superfamily)
MITYDDPNSDETAAHVFEVPDDAAEKEWKKREKELWRESEKLRRKLKAEKARGMK